jgi:hypothetical protein
MILVSLYGGLGNQMFQYACGKAVAARLGAELKLDIQHVTDRTPRKEFTFRDYELGVFNVNEQIATSKELNDFVPNLWNANEIVKHYYKLKRILLGNTLYREKLKFSYNKEIDLLKDNTYLYGYFQTEDYFSNFRNDILNSFSLRNVIDDKNAALVAQMQTESSVSIHIRRGDYENSVFELLSLEEYYLKAIETIKKDIESPVFYFFTNDIEWVEKNFNLLNINKKIITINTGKQSYMDLILMSNCKHNIIANSSFSWWGAWLNQNANKIVIAPKKWFKTGQYVETTYDLIPKSWLKI